MPIVKYIAFTVFILLLAGCKDHSHPDKKIFRYNESSGITSLDPLKATNLANIWAVQQIYEGLTCIDSLGNCTMLLADSFNVNSTLTQYDFYLKHGIKFHPDTCFGTSARYLTSYDIVYSYNRVLHSSSAWILNNVSINEDSSFAITAVDSFHVQIQLRSPSATFPQMLAMPPCVIIPHEAIAAYGTDFRRHPVGTGAFIFKVWHENERLVLNKNPEYHVKGLPLIDAVSISFLKDKQTALLEFIRGNMDLISGLDAAYKDELLNGDGELKAKYKDKVTLQKLPYLNTEYLGIRLNNKSTSPLQNVHIRKALNFSLDRRRLITYIRNGIGYAGHSGITPPVLLGEENFPGYTYDHARFLDELHKAGFSAAADVPEFTLFTDVAYTDVCTFIINQWNEAGFHTKLEVLDRPTLKSEVAKGNLEFFRASWIADYPDPENYLSLMYSPYKSPAGPNYSHFSSKGYDELYVTTLKETNDSIRIKKFMEMENLIMEQSPVIILYYDQAVRFINKRVKDLPPHPMNYLDLKRVDLN